MKIKTIRRIIKEEILRKKQLLKEYSSGYSVPEFQSVDDMERFLDELEPGDPVETDVEDPETFEMMIPAGESMEEQEWYEDSQWYVEPEEGPEEEKEPWETGDWEEQDRLDREEEEREEAEREAAEKKYEATKEKILNNAELGGEDWAMDTMYDASNNPSMWQGDGMNQYDSPADYVRGFGQDAAFDIASGYTEWADDEDARELYSSLSNEDAYGGYGRDYNDRPSKQLFKDIVADSVYTGVVKGIDKYIQKHGEWVSKEDPAKETISASYKRNKNIIIEYGYNGLPKVD